MTFLEAMNKLLDGTAEFVYDSSGNLPYDPLNTCVVYGVELDPLCGAYIIAWMVNGQDSAKTPPYFTAGDLKSCNWRVLATDKFRRVRYEFEEGGKKLLNDE